MLLSHFHRLGRALPGGSEARLAKDGKEGILYLNQ